MNRKKVLQIVVSLGRQKLTVYRNGQPIARSRISSGKAGHRTPKGIFSIIQKRRYHRSNIYSGAPMPFMQRITWSGVAMHMGSLPGYAASHGCVRLPSSFARKFFKLTTMRSHVVISDGTPVPRSFSHPNLPGFSDLSSQKLAVLTSLAGFADRNDPVSTDAETGSRGMTVPVKWTGRDGDGASALSTSSLQDTPSGRGIRAEDREWHEMTAILHFDQSEQLAHRHRVVRTRRSSPLRILVTRRTQRDKLRDVQRQLLALGYDVGELDGRLGRQMIGAVKEFQEANGLKVTGVPNDEVRDLLSVRSGLPQPDDGTVYVRQDGREIYSGPVGLLNANEPLGTHIYTLVDFDEDEGISGWNAMTLQAKGRLPSMSRRAWERQLQKIAAVSAEEAIDRIEFPEHVRQTIEDRLTHGSSVIIADRGSERETGLATDFIVLTD